MTMPTAIFDEFTAFIQRQQTVILATQNSKSLPMASYAPFILIEGKFYIYVSDLAAHTENLMHHADLGLLLIEDEQTADNLFARKRASIQGRAQEIARESESWHKVMELYVAQLGETAALLKSLQDFHLFQIQPCHATFVKGFAQAYELSGEDLKQVRHKNDSGHRPTKSD